VCSAALQPPRKGCVELAGVLIRSVEEKATAKRGVFDGVKTTQPGKYKARKLEEDLNTKFEVCAWDISHQPAEALRWVHFIGDAVMPPPQVQRAIL
jgi:hypothetical protein